jgi:hypothetical protein
MVSLLIQTRLIIQFEKFYIQIQTPSENLCQLICICQYVDCSNDFLAMPSKATGLKLPNTQKIARQQHLAIALGHGLLRDHTAKLGAALADGGQLHIGFRHGNGSAGVSALVDAWPKNSVID